MGSLFKCRNGSREVFVLLALFMMIVAVPGYAQWVETTIEECSAPQDLVYNSTNNKVYSANRGNNTVTVIDGAPNSVLATIVVGSFPRALVYNPTNNKVYCANDSR